jgi:hypothetical protein
MQELHQGHSPGWQEQFAPVAGAGLSVHIDKGCVQGFTPTAHPSISVEDSAPNIK